MASKAFYEHNFPAPHIDSVESFIDYQVPVAKVSPLAEFEGSVIVEAYGRRGFGTTPRRGGEFFALNPYMEGLRFEWQGRDVRLLSAEDLEQAVKEGEGRS